MTDSGEHPKVGYAYLGPDNKPYIFMEVGDYLYNMISLLDRSPYFKEPIEYYYIGNDFSKFTPIGVAPIAVPVGKTKGDSLVYFLDFDNLYIVRIDLKKSTGFPETTIHRKSELNLADIDYRFE